MSEIMRMWQKIKNIVHFFESLAACVWYRFPSRSMIVIGVTGTDGKTTTASLIYTILKRNGKRVAIISTLGAKIMGEEYDTGFHVTTPSGFFVQKYLRKAREKGCEFVILETTSHALDQNRVWGVNFSISVLTNITHEHLDYHGTLQNYRKAKLKLFKNSDICVLNKDDASFSIFKKELRDKKIIAYSLSKDADFSRKNTHVTSPIPGEFNTYNTIAAVAVVKSLVDISDKAIQSSLHHFKLPLGRQNIVYDKGFRVVVDFAHTPHSLGNVLSEFKKITEGRIIHVFGSAGERDRTKRPIMGRESSRYSDIILLTAEDPRREKVEEIAKQIQKGVKGFVAVDQKTFANNGTRQVLFFPRREQAIQFAIKIAEKNDSIILTGKGHEKSMNYGNGEEQWDEFKAVKNALKNR